MVYRVPETGAGDFRIGSQVVVRENQNAVFYRDGKALDTFGPGRHTITTANIPLLAGLVGLLTRGQTPFTAEVYFVNMRDFIDMKWGTPEPIALRDKDLGLARLRAYGSYSMAISDPQLFVTKIVGTQGLYQTSQIAGLPARHRREPPDRPAGRDQGGPVRSAGPVRRDERRRPHQGRRRTSPRWASSLKAMFIQSISPTEETPEGHRRARQHGRHRRYAALPAVQGGACHGRRRDCPVARRARRARALAWARASAWAPAWPGMISQAMSSAMQGQAAGLGAGAAAATPEVMNLTEAAAYLKVSEADVQGLIDSGQVKGKKIGSRISHRQEGPRRLPGVLNNVGAGCRPARHDRLSFIRRRPRDQVSTRNLVSPISCVPKGACDARRWSP